MSERTLYLVEVEHEDDEYPIIEVADGRVTGVWFADPGIRPAPAVLPPDPRREGEGT